MSCVENITTVFINQLNNLRFGLVELNQSLPLLINFVPEKLPQALMNKFQTEFEQYICIDYIHTVEKLDSV